MNDRNPEPDNFWVKKYPTMRLRRFPHEYEVLEFIGTENGIFAIAFEVETGKVYELPASSLEVAK